MNSRQTGHRESSATTMRRVSSVIQPAVDGWQNGDAKEKGDQSYLYLSLRCMYLLKCGWKNTLQKDKTIQQELNMWRANVQRCVC